MTERTVTYRLRALTSGLTGPVKQVRDEFTKTGKAAESFSLRNSQAMTKAGMAGVAFGAATALGLKNATDASISFESAFAGVRKTVDASEAEFAQMSADIRQLAKDIPVTVEEISGIGEAAGQLGISTDHLMDFTRTMADLGVATNMSSEEAATSLARLSNITGMSQDDFDRLGSTVVDLGNNLATTESEIVEMGLRLAGAGNQVGMAEAQILGLAGALSSVGIRAEAGGSAISKVMIEIASEVENGGDKLELFAETAGMSAEAFSTAYQEDATEAIIRFIEGLGDMEEQGGSTLQTLEALGIEEVRMRDALLRTSGAGDQLRQAIERGSAAWEENIALTVEAEQRYGTTESQLQTASNRINDMKIAVGDVLAPTLLSAADSVAGFAEGFSGLPEGMQEVIAKGALVASGLGLVGGAALIATPRLAAMNATLAATGPLGLAASRGITTAAGAMLGPWGLAAAGVTTAGFSMARAFRSGRDAADELAQEIATTSNSTEEAVGRMDRALEDHWDELETGGNAWKEVKNALMGPVGAFFSLRDAAEHATEAYGLWRTDVGQIRDIQQGEEAIERLSAGMDAWRERLIGTPEPVASVTEQIAGLGTGMDGAAESTDELSRLMEAQQTVIDGFGDPLNIYRSALSDKNEAERLAYESTATAMRDSGEEVAAFTASADLSLAEFAEAMEQRNSDMINANANFLEVTRRFGKDVTTELMAMGEEGVHIAAQMASGADAEGARMAAALRTNAALTRTGTMVELDALAAAMQATMGSAGTNSANAIARELGIGVGKVLEIAEAYGIALAEGINPVIVGIGGQEIAVSQLRALSLSNVLGAGPMSLPSTQDILGRNMGGPIPGSGPDRDSVLFAGTPGEFVARRRVVDEQGLDKFDLLNAGLADIIPRYNTGGKVVGQVAGLNAQFLRQLQMWAGALGDTYTVRSGLRSTARQAQLYALYKAGKGNLAARPGTSMHEFGLASDGNHWGGRNPGAFGMHYNVRGEPWHIEPVNARAMKGGAQMAGGLGGGWVQLPKPPEFPHNGIMGSADTTMGKLHEMAQAFVDANAWAPAVDTGAAPAASGSLQQMAQEMLNSRGWGGQWGAFDTLVRKESSWNPNAQNPTSTAFGLGQFLDSTWATVGGSKTSDPNLQLEYMMRYIADRYGTPAAALGFHRRNNWYDNGGLLQPGTTVATNDTGSPEVIAAQGMIRDEVRQAMPQTPSFPGSSTRLDPDEYARRVQVNNRLFELGITTLSDHLSNLERRMLRTVPFSDEWMGLFQDRKRLVDDLLDDHMRAVEDAQRHHDGAIADLNSLLDERNRITEDLADAQAQHDEQALEARQRYDEEFLRASRRRSDALVLAAETRNDDLLRVEQRFNDERARIISARADSLFDALPMEQRATTQWANSIGAILRNEMERATQRQDWAEGLDLLRGMGLSEDAIAAFGLEDLTEESIAKVKLWSQSTEGEIAALNAAIAERQRFAADQASEEAERQLGAVGESLIGLTEETATETARIHADHTERLAEINAEFHEVTAEASEVLGERLTELDAQLTDRLGELHEDMAAIGLDTGRSWADSIAEGIDSGVPGIMAAVENANAARMLLLRAESDLGQAREQAGANPPPGSSGSVAPLGHHYVLPDGRHVLRLSDQSWYWASGPGQKRELERLYGPGTDHPAIQEDRILGSLVSLFGAGGMERFASAQIQPRYFDQGGWLPPHSVTLAANATSRWEPVGVGTHMASQAKQTIHLHAKVMIGDRDITDMVQVEIGKADHETAMELVVS